MKDDIKHALRKQFQANIDKHAINVRVMMNNPMAIHDHTDFMGAIELELGHIAEYKDKLEALEHI
jgi:hypothetical protein